MYVEHDTPATRAADARRGDDPDGARALEVIAANPQAMWLTGGTTDVRRTVERRAIEAARAAALPVFVAYNLPGRDCGGHSRGGAGGLSAYRSWVDAIASGIGSRPAVVIVEPDGLAGLQCLPAAERRGRLAVISRVVRRLAANPATAVYIDAGHAGWVRPREMARRLRRAGVGRARGFAVNVANFRTTPESIAHGRRISAALGGVPFVIDTSRNGAGPATDGAWCNPPGRALGSVPTVNTGDPRVDAFLWVKRPGESDGTCEGGPDPGTFWPEYAIGLAQRSQD